MTDLRKSTGFICTEEKSALNFAVEMIQYLSCLRMCCAGSVRQTKLKWCMKWDIYCSTADHGNNFSLGCVRVVGQLQPLSDGEWCYKRPHIMAEKPQKRMKSVLLKYLVTTRFLLDIRVGSLLVLKLIRFLCGNGLLVAITGHHRSQAGTVFFLVTLWVHLFKTLHTVSTAEVTVD